MLYEFMVVGCRGSRMFNFGLGLDRYRYRVSADTCQYQWVSVSADTYF